MSLDNILNPNGGSLADKLDNAMVRFHERIALKWQEKTHKTKDYLQRRLYLGSAAILLVNAVTSISSGDYVLALATGSIAADNIRKCLTEQQKPDDGMKGAVFEYINVVLYDAGFLSTLAGVGMLVGGAMTGNNELSKHAVPLITYGLGAVAWKSADYLADSNFDNPSPKPESELDHWWGNIPLG